MRNRPMRQIKRREQVFMARAGLGFYAVITLSCAEPPPPITPGAPSAPSGPICNVSEESQWAGEPMTFRETTQPDLAGYYVGISNIFERDLPDDKGVIAPRMSANLTITNPKTDESRYEKVFAGNVITIGADRYCIVK